MTGQWVTLYHAKQDTFHVEPLRTYEKRPTCGWRLLAVCDDSTEAFAIADKGMCEQREREQRGQ